MSASSRSCVVFAQGKAGNAAQYLTRNQAIKKLQLRLSEFR
jgi:pescadillo protein